MNPLELEVGDIIRYPNWGEREDEKVITINYSCQMVSLKHIESGAIQRYSFINVSKFAGFNLSARQRKIDLWKTLK